MSWMCLSSAHGPQVTNVCLWGTRKTYFLPKVVGLSAPYFMVGSPWAQPIKRKTKPDRDLLVRVFVRLTPITCISFEF